MSKNKEKSNLKRTGRRICNPYAKLLTAVNQQNVENRIIKSRDYRNA